MTEKSRPVCSVEDQQRYEDGVVGEIDSARGGWLSGQLLDFWWPIAMDFVEQGGFGLKLEEAETLLDQVDGGDKLGLVGLLVDCAIKEPDEEKRLYYGELIGDLALGMPIWGRYGEDGWRLSPDYDKRLVEVLTAKKTDKHLLGEREDVARMMLLVVIVNGFKYGRGEYIKGDLGLEVESLEEAVMQLSEELSSLTGKANE